MPNQATECQRNLEELHLHYSKGNALVKKLEETMRQEHILELRMQEMSGKLDAITPEWFDAVRHNQSPIFTSGLLVRTLRSYNPKVDAVVEELRAFQAEWWKLKKEHMRLNTTFG